MAIAPSTAALPCLRALRAFGAGRDDVGRSLPHRQQEARMSAPSAARGASTARSCPSRPACVLARPRAAAVRALGRRAARQGCLSFGGGAACRSSSPPLLSSAVLLRLAGLQAEQSRSLSSSSSCRSCRSCRAAELQSCRAAELQSRLSRSPATAAPAPHLSIYESMTALGGPSLRSRAACAATARTARSRLGGPSLNSSSSQPRARPRPRPASASREREGEGCCGARGEVAARLQDLRADADQVCSEARRPCDL
jgi:hypothetical protein